MPIFRLGDKHPWITDPVWIAHNAVVIGDVRLAANVSIWWNTVVRGDNDPITIGENTNIQDACVLHTDEGVPLSIGSDVTVGHRAMLHGCTVGEGSLIGIGATILNHSVIGRECLIGAHTLVPEGKVIPDRVLVVGSPGKIVRELEEREVAALRTSAANYVLNWKRYLRELQPA